MTLRLKDMLCCPVSVFCFIAGICVFSLGAALFAQFALDMKPCILCLYQRAPFLAALVLSMAGLILRDNMKAAAALAGACALVFLANAGIAFYHTGVELHWWVSAEGCAVHFGNDTASILEQITSAPTGRCDEIPWADPVFGLSMANYNVLLCAGMAAFCGLSACLMMLRPHPSPRGQS